MQEVQICMIKVSMAYDTVGFFRTPIQPCLILLRDGQSVILIRKKKTGEDEVKQRKKSLS